MTVGDWIAARVPAAPESLQDRVRQALRSDVDAPGARTADVCLRAAAAILRGLIEGRRFGRDSAADLLAVDALMTYAFEYASAHGTASQLAELARRGEHLIGEIALQHG